MPWEQYTPDSLHSAMLLPKNLNQELPLPLCLLFICSSATLQSTLIGFYDCLLLPRNSPEQCVALVRKTNHIQWKAHLVSLSSLFSDLLAKIQHGTASKVYLWTRVYFYIDAVFTTCQPWVLTQGTQNLYQHWEIQFHNTSLRLVLFS